MLRLLLALFSNWAMLFIGLVLSFILWKVFAFAFVVAFHQAAIRCLTAASALTPIAQMKPNNS